MPAEPTGRVSEDGRYDPGPSLDILFSSLNGLAEVHAPCSCDNYVAVRFPRKKEALVYRTSITGKSRTEQATIPSTPIMYVDRIRISVGKQKAAEILYTRKSKPRSTTRRSSIRTSSSTQETCREVHLWGSSKACRAGHQQDTGPRRDGTILNL